MWRSKVLTFCLILCLGVSTMGRLFNVSADEQDVTIGGYTQEDYEFGLTLANLFAMGYALEIPADYITVIPGGAPNNPGNTPVLDWAGYRNTQSAKFMDSWNSFLSSVRQREALKKIFEIHGLTQDPNVTAVHIPIGVSDYWNTTGKNYSYTAAPGGDGPNYISAADINLSSTPYFDDTYDWYVTGSSLGDTYVIVNQYSFRDTDGHDHGMFYYLSNPNVIPATPSQVYASNYNSNLKPNGLYIRGGNSYSSMEMYPAIDILLPPADSTFYSSGYTWLQLSVYGSGLSGNSFGGSLRNGENQSNQIYSPDIYVAREYNGNTYTDTCSMVRLGSANQFTGPHYMIYDVAYGHSQFMSLSIPYNGGGLEGLISEACGMFAGNGLNIYVGNSWSDAETIASYGSSVTPVETNGVKPYNLPGNANHDSTWNLTELLNWLQEQLLNHPNGLKLDANDLPDPVITPENEPDPVPLEEVVPSVVKEASPENQPDPDGETPDPDANLPLSLPHATDGNKLWSLRLHSSGEALDDEGTDSPVQVAINLFQMADAATGGIFVYVLSIIGVLLVTGVIIRLLHG